VSDAAGVPVAIDKDLENARTSLADMESRYTDDHPDVKKLKETIASLEKLKKDMAAEAKEKIESNDATPSQLQAMAPLVQLKSQMKINGIEIQQTTQEMQRLQQSAQVYQARLNATRRWKLRWATWCAISAI